MQPCGIHAELACAAISDYDRGKGTVMDRQRRLAVLLITSFAAQAIAAPLPPGDYELEPGGRYTFTTAGSPPPASYSLTVATTGTGTGTVDGCRQLRRRR